MRGDQLYLSSTILFGLLVKVRVLPETTRRCQWSHHNQCRTLLKQLQIIQQKQEEILDSIKYARRIQQSLMPTEKYIERKLNSK